MKVECRLDVWLDDTFKEKATLVMMDHWNDKGLVWLSLGGEKEYLVSANDLRKAIANATNC